MPSRRQNPGRDPIDREVDRLLRQLDPPTEPAPARPPRSRPRPTHAPPQRPISLPSPLGVWGRVGLGAVLAGALTQWPYQTCGLPLVGYLAAVMIVLAVGVWAGYASWRRRMGLAHLIAIALVFAAAALTAHQVLPRFGYAPVEVTWRCPG